MSGWLLAFLFTQAIEVPLYLRALRTSPHRLLIAFGASTLTHPVVWFVFPRVPLAYAPMVALAELFAVLTEAWWLHLFGLRRAWRWSLAANMTSLGLGLLCRAAWGWP